MQSSSWGWRMAVGLLATVAACNEEPVENVPTDVCASGKIWVGELTASEEMYPGYDCVSCHRALDGPPLMAAGTIYGVIDPDGNRTVRDHCFGVEGAHVTITMEDGEVLETHTNRAGNFYFEGRPESLVGPFSVVVDYTLPDGRRTVQPMKTHPSYGGCGYCHDPAVMTTPGVEPGGTPAREEAIGVVPIFTGPLYE